MDNTWDREKEGYNLKLKSILTIHRYSKKLNTSQYASIVLGYERAGMKVL